jgi:hypothetical protein
MNEKTLNRLKPFFYGKLLGDATIEKTAKSTHNNRMKIKQKFDHKDYVVQCWNKIHNFSNKVFIDKSARTHKGVTKFHKSYCFKTKAIPTFSNMRKEWYNDDGRKVLPSDLEAFFNWEAFAYWYMDDGTLTQSSANYYEMFLYTNNFTENEVDRLVVMLHNLGIKSAVKRRERVKKDGEASFIIRIGNMEDERFITSNIEKFIPDCMRYKIRGLI